jgi:hypothetical protein
MAVRGEEVASSIEAHVREAIERMVGEIRSSVEDVRTAVDSQLKAALQSVQADVNSISFLPHIQKSIGDLEETLKAAQPPAPAPVADASRLKEAVQAVERARSQIDVLNALLEQCLHFGSRAALLILRGETFSGWKGVGFSAHGGNDELVKRFNAAPGLIPELDRVLRNEQVVIWDGVNLSTRLGVSASQRAILVPMVIKDKVAAAVYVDATAQDAAKLDATSVELLVFTTGLLIDTLSIRKKTPSPSLTESAAAVAPPPPPPPPEEPAGASSTVAISAAQMREMIAPTRPEPSAAITESFTTTALPAVQPSPRPAPPPPAPPAHDERPSTQYVPPAGIRGAASFTPSQTEEGKKHDEARRFARLLVSEIKLYNEGKVEQGRKNKDLYERLKEDIDRSRQMYDERIPDEVRKTSNYFYDELVRILADGDAGSLGL